MKSFAEKALTAIELAIESRASESMLSMSIGGKAIAMMTLVEQFDVRDRLIREVNQEKLAAKNQSPFQTIRVRM